MSLSRISGCIFCLFTAWFLVSCGSETSSEVVAPPSERAPLVQNANPSSGASRSASAINISETSRLRSSVGKEVTIVGRVTKTGRARSGMQFLNFSNPDFTVVCRGGDVGSFSGGGPADLYDGKEIQVTGKVELYKGKPQIVLTDPGQVHVAGGASNPVVASTPPRSESGKAGGGKLTKRGRDTWESPAGLVYKGRDPKGLTRVEHVMRHGKDIPGRNGPHGVFLGNQDEIIALIDEAWNVAQKKRIKPKKDRGRSSLTVPMGRKVGFLGGKTGARKGRPALKSVFIVYETGRKNIVTAFPK